MYWLHWLYYLLLLLLNLTGLGLAIVSLPGLWLMVGATAAFAWVTGFNVYVGWPGLITVLALAALAEIAEFLAGAAGTKQAGGSKRGMLGAIVGGIVGAIVLTPYFPVVGTIAGACLGSFAGAFAIETAIGREYGDAATIGVGAAKGRLYGTILKLIFGVLILLVSAIAALPI